jgi:hypothetical protein
VDGADREGTDVAAADPSGEQPIGAAAGRFPPAKRWTRTIAPKITMIQNSIMPATVSA